MNCPYSMAVKPLDPQRNALRVEAIVNNDRRCTLRAKPEAERLKPFLWVASGGCPRDVYEECHGDSCRKWVEADTSIMNTGKSGPCPHCRSINRMEFEKAHEAIKCRECGYLFVLFDGPIEPASVTKEGEQNAEI